MERQNPPAFPIHPGINIDLMSGHEGMTLRDWFAGQAPVTLFDAAMTCGWSGLEAENMGKDSYRTALWAVMALMRYEYADAMLAARTTPPAERNAR